MIEPTPFRRDEWEFTLCNSCIDIPRILYISQYFTSNLLRNIKER
nr:MAG TPA: hypothetical protein [Caudoviricetes sp.]